MEDRKAFSRPLSAPFFRHGDTVRGLMLMQLAALAVIVIFSACFFGLRVVMLALSGALGAFAAEFAWQYAAKRDSTVGDMSAVVCGVACACMLPASSPVWLPLVAGAFAGAVAKLPFGPLGHSPFSPCAAGTAFAVMLGATARASIPYSKSDEKLWSLLPQRLFDCPENGILPVLRDVITPDSVDVLDRLSPLMLLRAGEDPHLSASAILLGGQKGAICAALVPLVIAGIWLIITRTAAWQSCAAYTAAVFVLSFVFKYDGVSGIMSGVYELVCGCTLFVALFIVGDTLTAPHTGSGRVIFGIFTAVLTVILRRAGALEGAEVFAALLAGALAPALDSFIHYCRLHNISFTAAKRSYADAMRRRREKREERGDDAVTR